LWAFLISSMLSSCAGHIILFDLISLIIFGEEYKLWSSLWNFYGFVLGMSKYTPSVLHGTSLI
jgi:hypothetical protein